MATILTRRNPQYYFAVFGNPGMTKPKVEDGDYPHKGYISSLDMTPGDVILLYCTLNYTQYPMEAPGVGVVIDTSENNVYYQYFPLDKPVSWSLINTNLNEYNDRLKVLSSKGNWLFKIDRNSFRAVIDGRNINWP